MNRLQIAVGVLLLGVAILLYLISAPGRNMELGAYGGFALIVVAYVALARLSNDTIGILLVPVGAVMAFVDLTTLGIHSRVPGVAPGPLDELPTVLLIGTALALVGFIHMIVVARRGINERQLAAPPA